LLKDAWQRTVVRRLCSPTARNSGENVLVSFIFLVRALVVITDAGIPAEFKSALDGRNIQVLVAQPGSSREGSGLRDVPDTLSPEGERSQAWALWL